MKRFFLLQVLFFAFFSLYAQSQFDFDHEIFSAGPDFLEDYEYFVASGDISLLENETTRIKNLLDDYRNTESFVKVSKNDREIRELFKRINVDVDFILLNKDSLNLDENRFFCTDLSQCLFILNNYKTEYLSKMHMNFFTLVVRIGACVILVFVILILGFFLHIGFMKSKIYSTELHARRSEVFAHAIFEAQEKERERLSYELHDTIAQEIRAIRLEAETSGDKNISDLAGNCMKEIRSICYNLMPPDLKLENSSTGIETILSFLCDGFSQFSKIECIFKAQENLVQIKDQKVLINLFRIVQESLNNVAKHSGAENCSVLVKNLSGEKEGLLIFVTDDGCGFDTSILANKADEKDIHFGLQSMRSRADLIGAKLEINSNIDDGTEVKIVYEL